MSSRPVIFAVIAASVLVVGCSDQSQRKSGSQSSGPTPQPKAVELSEALLKGLIKVSVSGDGLESLGLSIESTSDDPLEVTVSAGTVFQANSGGTQNMVTREDGKVTVRTRGSKQSLAIDAACANMDRNTPSGSDTFIISKTPASEDLKKLLRLPGFRRKSFRVQQFAIWTITDNPSRGGYVGIGEFGFGSGPSDNELQSIKTSFEQAGISTQKYRALR